MGTGEQATRVCVERFDLRFFYTGDIAEIVSFTKKKKTVAKPDALCFLYSTVKRNRTVMKQSGIPLDLQDLMGRGHHVHPLQRQKCTFKYSFKESSHRL